MEEDFSALTADTITEILARSVSADDLAKFGAASKGTTAATQAQDFWKRATAARWPEYAKALDSCTVTPIPVEEGYDGSEDREDIGDSESAAAALVKVGSSSWKFFYYFRDVYETVADAIAANKKEGDYMQPPSRVPSAESANSMSSTLYSMSMSKKLPVSPKVIADLVTPMMRLVKDRGTMWNMGKTLSCCMSIPDAKAALEESFAKNFEVWVPFMTHCMRVREGPAKAPSFYLFQEVRFVAIQMLRSVSENAELGLEVAKIVFSHLHKQIASFLASAKFEDDHLTASLVMASAAAQLIKGDILQRLAGSATFENNTQALERLQHFLVSEAFLKVKHGERAQADPHNSHYPVAQVFSMSSALMATLHATQLNLAEPAAQAKLDAFVQQTLNDLLSAGENQDKLSLGMTALNVVASALEHAKNLPLYKKLASSILSFGADHNLPFVSGIYTSSKYVPITQFEAFQTKILPKLVDQVLSAADAHSTAEAAQELMQNIGSIPSVEYAAMKTIKEQKDALIKKFCDSLAEIEVGDDGDLPDSDIVSMLFNVLAAIAEPYGAEGCQAILKSPSLPNIIKQTLALSKADLAPNTIIGILAWHGKEQLQAHSDVWKQICDGVLATLPMVSDIFSSCVGLGAKSDDYDNDESAGSYANIYWAAHKICMGFPEFVKPTFDQILASLDGKRAYSGNVCDNMVLVWVGLLSIDAKKTSETLKQHGNDLFFASSTAHMSAVSEKLEALNALKNLSVLDAEAFAHMIQFSSKPNAFADEAQIVQQRQAARTVWRKKAQEALDSEDYDFGFTDDTKEPADIKPLKDLTEEEHTKWIEFVANAIGKEIADKIK